MSDALIVAVIHRYHPEWHEPPDNGYDWISTLCPFHQETNRSASVSYTRNAFHCFACSTKGDAISLIRHQEGVNFEKAKRIAEELSAGSCVQISQQSGRKSRRRVFEDAGIHTSPGEQVSAGIRGRPTPWT